MHALEKKLADCSQLIISLTLIQMRGLPMYLIVEFVWNFSNECSLHLLNAENINSQLSFLCPFAQKSEVFEFTFSEKVTKIDKIFTVNLTVCSNRQIDDEDFGIFSRI